VPLLELNPGRKNSWRWLPILLFFSVLVTFLGLRTVLASNITTNGGNPINFGQGVTTVTSCSGKESIIITPKVSFVNNSKTADAFYFSSVTVANIPATCYGKDFQLNAYDSNGTTSPLALFNTTQKDVVIYNNNGEFSAAKGSTAGLEIITNSTSSFTVIFTEPVALSTSVFAVTLQSTSHSASNCLQDGMDCLIGQTGPGGGIVFYYDPQGFNCGSTFTATGSLLKNKCHTLEAAPRNWYYSLDPNCEWAYCKIPDNDPALYWAVSVGSIPGVNPTQTSVPAFHGLNATGSQMGIGFANSEAIIDQMGPFDPQKNSYAAGAARAYLGNGFNDWYMPSWAELEQLCALKGVGGFVQNVTYLSSTEARDDFYSSILFSGDELYNFGGNGYFKSWHDFVRPIRAF